jgi:hypothetical protein
MPWIEQSYGGSLTVANFLYKRKCNAHIGLLFGKYVKRLFLLDLKYQLLCYYSDINFKNPRVIEINVRLKFNLIGNKDRV